MKKFMLTVICVITAMFFMEDNDMSVVSANNYREEAVRLAASEVGYLEKDSLEDLYDNTANAGTNNYTKYAVDLAVVYGQPWNATFFWWVMSTTGVPREAYPTRTTVTGDWFRERDMFRETTDYIPQPGDYIILGDREQCGIVESADENTVTYIAGNINDSVARVTRDLDDTYIYGYGLIDYDYVYQPTGLDLGDTFCAIISKTSTGKQFRNYNEKPVMWTEINRADYRWLFKKQEDGTYMIQSLYDGKVLEVKDSGTERYTEVILGDIKETDNNHQKWYILYFGVGYRLIPKNATNFCLEMATDNDGSGMWIWQHHDGMQQMCSLTQINYVGLSDVSIASDYDKIMYVDESQILEYSLAPEDASSDMVSWVSSDNSVAEVDENGIVKAKKEGMVTLFCKSTYDNSISDKVTIQVKSNATEATTEEMTTQQQEASTEQQTTEQQTIEQQESSTEQKEETTTEANTEESDEIVKKGTRIEGKQCRFEITSVKDKAVKVIGISNKKSTKLTIPATVEYKGITYKVTSIGKNAFKNNKKIKTVVIGNNVKMIQANAFLGCKKLTKVVIGKKVTSIGKKAFYECKKLKTIDIKSTKLKKIGSNAFKKIDKTPVIYAPKKKMSKYKKLFEGNI